MIKFINRTFGNEMWVADERKEEYLAAGHKLAVENPKPAAPVLKPKKTGSKKSTKK